MLIEDFEDNPDVCDDLNRIRNAGKRLLTMISEILDLAKLDAGRVKVDKKPTKRELSEYELMKKDIAFLKIKMKKVNESLEILLKKI